MFYLYIVFFSLYVNPIFANLHFFSMNSGLEDLQSYDSYGPDSEFFNKKIHNFSNSYQSVAKLIPLSNRQNSIQLNENGKVLYRVLNLTKNQDDAILYLYDSRSDKVTKIIEKVGEDSYDCDPPYRLNNHDQVLYFKSLKDSDDKYTINLLSKG